MALVLIGAVADFAEAVEEYGAAERILLLTLVEADVASTAQLGVLQPLERKEGRFQLSQFAQGERQAVLAGIGRELAQDHRGGDCSRFDRQGEAQQFEPMIANDAKIDSARRQRSELGRHGHARQYIESLFLQVANARRKAEAQQTAHGKDMIGEAPGVGVVLVNDEAAPVIKQSVEDIRRFVSPFAIPKPRRTLLGSRVLAYVLVRMIVGPLLPK